MEKDNREVIMENHWAPVALNVDSTMYSCKINCGVDSKTVSPLVEIFV